MAVLPSDLLAPQGELEPSLFPGDDSSSLSVRLSRYLSDAGAVLAGYPDGSITPAQSDRAQSAYAYAESYAAIYRRMAAAPMSATLADQGSVTYNIAQMREFKALSESKRAEFTSLLPIADPVTDQDQWGLLARSGAVPTRVSW